MPIGSAPKAWRAVATILDLRIGRKAVLIQSQDVFLAEPWQPLVLQDQQCSDPMGDPGTLA